MAPGCAGGVRKQDPVQVPRELVVPCIWSAGRLDAPRWCLLMAKPKSGQASRALSRCSRFMVINQITVISLRGEFRFYLQK